MNFRFDSVRLHAFGIGLLVFFSVQGVSAIEWAIEPTISARAEYNDNIFLDTRPHDGVSKLGIMPGIKILAREKNWETFINSRLSSNNYSDKNLDSNDKFFDMTGKYFSELDTFSLNGTYNLDSSLNTESSDFGITARRVNRKLLSIAPQYVRMLTERLVLQLGYTHTDVDYDDTVNTGFVAYNTDMASASFIYNLTELDLLNYSLQAVDYESKDKQFEYQMIISNIGMSHKLSESFSIDYQLGISRRDSISRSTESIPFDINGEIITRVLVTDFNNDGLVLDLGFKKSWETSSLSGRFNRDNTTDSFGGLNEVNQLRLQFTKKVTSLLRYSINTRYEDVESVSAGNRFADRQSIFFEPILYYSLDRDWVINASYRYIQREFKNNANSAGAPHSNRVFAGITYNFPPISTF